jgi:putative addiction module component (TIGR02574 family)
MASRAILVDELTAQQRVELIGQLWDSLDPAAAAPITNALAAELDRREAEADADPDAGEPWLDIKSELANKLR